MVLLTRAPFLVPSHLRSELAAVRTPHSGYHYNGQRRRFFEGWYFKVYAAFMHTLITCLPAVPSHRPSRLWLHLIHYLHYESVHLLCGSSVNRASEGVFSKRFSVLLLACNL